MARERITSSDTRPPESRETKLENTHTPLNTLWTSASGLARAARIAGGSIQQRHCTLGLYLTAGGDNAKLGQACRMTVQAGKRTLQAVKQSALHAGRQVLVKMRLG